jgi:hypothetical protein
MLISQIRELSTEVEQLGLDFQDDVLIVWVKELRQAIDDFDTTRIGLTLRRLAELLPT